MFLQWITLNILCRDEDDEMRKYIETEMEKIKGGGEDEEKDPTSQYMTPEDAALMALPEHLRKSTFKKDQQMLSAQMLTGIPEVSFASILFHQL